MAAFGFETRDSITKIPKDAPLQRFALYCDRCVAFEVRVRCEWGEGEMDMTLVCPKCGARERVPARLLGHA